MAAGERRRSRRAQAGAQPSGELAPCGLVELDQRGVIVAANARFLGRVARSAEEVVGRVAFSQLLTPGSRLFYDSQIVALLQLDGAVHELMLDLMVSDERRVPVLVSAERTSDGGTRLALMSVPDRREYEDELLRARRLAEEATATGARALQRLDLLAQANAALASSIEVEVALDRLAQTLVPRVADWCLIYVVDPERREDPPHWSAAHIDSGRQRLLERLAALIPPHASSQSSLTKILDGAPAVLHRQVSDEHLRTSTDDPEVREIYAQLDLGSALVAPSSARGQQVAAMVLVRGRARDPFSEDDRADLTDLASRTGIVIDNLRRYAREHHDSLTLQHALLTAPVPSPGLEIVSRYVPATYGAQVGGDWYDSFSQPAGTVVVIGDVVGHDMQAAASMGQLRGVIRTIGHTTGGPPGDTLTRADLAARGLLVDVLASAVVARFEPLGPDGGCRLRWSNAGHPPPFLIRRDGTVTLLTAPVDPLLGAAIDLPRHDHVTDLRPGDTVLLYTDGLIERRDEGIDDGLARLADTLEAVAGSSLDALCELVLRRSPTGTADDVALLAVRVRPGGDGAP